MIKKNTRRATKVIDLMNVLVAIDQNGSKTAQQIGEELGVSRVTIARAIYRLRIEYLIVIQRPIGTHKTYTVLDWGLLDRDRVYAYVNHSDEVGRKSPVQAAP